jgi:HSP20 family protein
MANIVPRENVFSDLFDFRRSFDEMFDRFLSGSWLTENQSNQPPVETYVDNTAKTFHCRMPLAGIDPKDVQIHSQGRTLMVKGDRKMDRREDADILQSELWYGAFERTVALPEGVDVDKLNAEHHNGMLEITAPVAASALRRRIEIKTAPKAKQVAA